ncbi:MAG TPA: peptide MFS transporter [Phycisphaerales bacterium]|nr:peptide MFS transporter [Phycisphaerales bacterium]
MASYRTLEVSDPDHNIPPSDFQMPDGPTLLGHPRGLFLLFFVEMWERFSYYGMRALLVLYLIENAARDHQTNDGIINPGRGWEEGSANALYGVYTGLAYLLPVAGGFIADKLLGTHRSMVLGGVLIALGHISLAISGIGEMAHNALGMSVFIFGLATIIIGTGYFKPCVSTMVGQLYRPGDPKRDGGFSIFYMGINLGAFLCALVCGTLGQKLGWHWGFGSAAVGMIAGLVMYFIGRPLFLKNIGDPPAGKPNYLLPLLLVSLGLSALVGWLYHTGTIASTSTAIGDFIKYTGVLVPIVLSALILGAIIWFIAIQKRGDRGPTATIFIFMTFNIFFWIAFEQAGSTLNVFADKSTELPYVPGWGDKMPSTWFQSFNAAFIILLAPIFTWLWGALGRHNPSQPVKIALGLLLVGLGYIPMVFAAKLNADNGVLVSMMWLTSLYFIHTLGELCLSPTGLSYVTKAAPAKYVSLLMGIWFISSFVANLGGGLIASQVQKVESGEIKMPWAGIIHFGGRADYFMLFVVLSIGAGLIILGLSPFLKKLMRNPND